MDDAASIRACRAGHMDALRHLVDRYQARALAQARLLTRNDIDVADAAQEAFIDDFRGLGAAAAALWQLAWPALSVTAFAPELQKPGV